MLNSVLQDGVVVGGLSAGQRVVIVGGGTAGSGAAPRLSGKKPPRWPDPARFARRSNPLDWILSLTCLLGGVVLLMMIGLPVALSFLVTNVVAAYVYMGGLAGVDQLARNSIATQDVLLYGNWSVAWATTAMWSTAPATSSRSWPAKARTTSRAA